MALRTWKDFGRVDIRRRFRLYIYRFRVALHGNTVPCRGCSGRKTVCESNPIDWDLRYSFLLKALQICVLSQSQEISGFPDMACQMTGLRRLLSGNSSVQSSPTTHPHAHPCRRYWAPSWVPGLVRELLVLVLVLVLVPVRGPAWCLPVRGGASGPAWSAAGSSSGFGMRPVFVVRSVPAVQSCAVQRQACSPAQWVPGCSVAW